MLSEGNFPIWRTNSWGGGGLFHANAPAHRPVLIEDFSAKNNVTTLQHPPILLAAADFYLFPRLKTVLNGRRFWDATDIIKIRWETEKTFTKWLPGMFPILLTLLADLYSCTKGLFWGKCSLNDRTIMYFSEIKWFRVDFENRMCDNNTLRDFCTFQLLTLKEENRLKVLRCSGGFGDGGGGREWRILEN